MRNLVSGPAIDHCSFTFRCLSDLILAKYLSELRSSRVARPSGARPPPPSSRRESDRGISNSIHVEDVPKSPTQGVTQRSSSGFSHRRARSSLSTFSSVTSRTGRALVQQPRPAEETPILKPSDVVPTATYMERGQRWMEKEEAVSLREAMEDMDLKTQDDEEARIHAAALDEAAELVWQHAVYVSAALCGYIWTYWKTRQQSVITIHQPLVGSAVWMHQQFGHGECRRHGGVRRPLQPGKNLSRQFYVRGICFEVVDDDAGIERDSAMFREESAQQSQSEQNYQCTTSRSGS